jgi:hypothetical protein
MLAGEGHFLAVFRFRNRIRYFGASRIRYRSGSFLFQHYDMSRTP